MAKRGRKAGRTPVDPNETKAARFIRLATARLNRALSTIDGIGKLRGSNYESTTEQRAKIKSLLITAVNEAIENLERTGGVKRDAVTL